MNDSALTPRVSPQATLLALADRCEREEPSLELCDDIARGIGWIFTMPLPGQCGWKSPGNQYAYVAPQFCFSLDAAVTLVPKDAQEIVVRAYPTGMYVRITMASGKVVYCEGFANKSLTEPMARCAAALRARASLEEK